MSGPGGAGPALEALRRHLPAYLFVAPALLVLCVFVILPMLTALVLSFASWNLVGPVKWVGLANYALLFQDPTFARSLLNSLVYTAGSATLGIAGALLLALALEPALPGIGGFRAILFLPALMSEVIVAMVFQWLYNADFGLLNYALQLAHLPKVPWLTSPTFAMLAVVLMGAWVGAAYNAPILLSGLQSINPTFYEAARLDGATPWQEFRFVTFPLLRPFTLYVLVMALIGSFQVFGRIFVLTGGGPVDSTLVAVQYIYRVAFSFNQMGYAAALSVAVFAILIVLTALQLRFFRREDAA
ncbi:MAG: sugar ABC transporter permease [Candidatus Sericytochromatia bacterium]|nr:sugar ABC transporter permease [Candidatus Tanganyikabacteria bacterium]